MNVGGALQIDATGRIAEWEHLRGAF